MNELKLISTKQAREALKNLNNLKWQAFEGGDPLAYINGIEKELYRFFPQISLIGKHAKASVLSNKTFYRVRFTEDIENLTDENEYGCPLPKFVQSNQRANLKNYPVFYVSDNSIVSILEALQIHSKVKNLKGRVSVVCWSYKGDEGELVFPVFSRQYMKLNPDSEWSNFDDESFRSIGNHDATSDQIEALRLISDWFAESFVNDTRRTWSSAFAHRAIYENSIKEALIIFPSIQSKLLGSNFAFHPKIVNTKMTLERLYHISLRELNIVGQKGVQCNFDHLGCFFREGNKINFERDEVGNSKFYEYSKVDFS